MKILFNCSVNVVGGAVQNAANFIKYALRDELHSFVFAVSKPVFHVLEAWGIHSEFVFVFDSPSKSKSARKEILNLEKKFSPDLVYTMAGPTYINFKAFHVMGVSDPYITHADLLAWKLNRRFSRLVRDYAKSLVKGVIARLSADYFIFQTETSRKGFCKRFVLPAGKTAILPNAIGEDFFWFTPLREKNISRPCNIFVPSAYYSHKNLEIILDVCKILHSESRAEDFLFTTTAPFGSDFERSVFRLGLESIITNVGPYNYTKAYDLYMESDVVFIPSVLETFSTSYLEAIAMSKPLVVADRAFSREICSNYADYYSALSASEAVKCLTQAVSKEVVSGVREKIISKYGSQEKRYANLLSIIEELKI